MLSQKVIELSKAGCNCAQSVALTFCEKYDLSHEHMLRLCNGLGGGMGSQGEVCGALTAAILIVGLKHGSAEIGNKEARGLCRKLTGELFKDFQNVHGAVRCRDILVIDISTAEGAQQAKPLFETKCREIMQETVRMLEARGY